MLCDIVFGFIGMFALASIIYTKQNIFKDFLKKLSSDQKHVFDSISRERLWIGIFAFIFSLIATYGVSYLVNEKYFISRLCVYILCLVFFTTIIYVLFPKSDYLVLHLNKDQIRSWINIIEYIKFILVLGFIIGIIFYFIFSKLFKKIF